MYLNKVLCITWYLCSIFNIVYKIDKLAKRNSTFTKGCIYIYTTMQPGGVQTFSWFYTLLAFHINSYKIWTKNLTIWEKLLYTWSKFFSGEKANIKQVFRGESSHGGKTALHHWPYRSTLLLFAIDSLYIIRETVPN